jgi:hypothetical protein
VLEPRVVDEDVDWPRLAREPLDVRAVAQVGGDGDIGPR